MKPIYMRSSRVSRPHSDRVLSRVDTDLGVCDMEITHIVVHGLIIIQYYSIILIQKYWFRDLFDIKFILLDVFKDIVRKFENVNNILKTTLTLEHIV